MFLNLRLTRLVRDLLFHSRRVEWLRSAGASIESHASANGARCPIWIIQRWKQNARIPPLTSPLPLRTDPSTSVENACIPTGIERMKQNTSEQWTQKWHTSQHLRVFAFKNTKGELWLAVMNDYPHELSH